jgi:predicted  nucleic acid-binding Zn-ribbon protein
MTEDRFKSIEIEIHYLKQRLDSVNSDLKEQVDMLRTDFKEIFEKSQALSVHERKQILDQLNELSKGINNVKEDALATRTKMLENSLGMAMKGIIAIIGIAGGIVTYLAQKLGIF